MQPETTYKTELTNKFDQFPSMINGYRMNIANIEIKNEETLLAAQTKLSQGKTIVDNIDKVRKVIKEPYLKAGKEIDAYSKLLSEPLIKDLDLLKLKTKTYIEVQAAQARAEAAKVQAEIDSKRIKTEEELSLLERITKQLQARLFGGTYTTNSGTFNSAGCKSIKDCDELHEYIINNFPNPKSYSYIEDALEALKLKCLVDIAKIKNAMVDDNPNKILSIRDAETKRMNLEFSAIESKHNSEIKKQEKGIAESIREARKGLSKKLGYVVTNEDKVPIQFWSIDEAKIKTYLSENREEIYNSLEEGSQIIPGVEFTIENIYSNR